MSILGAAVSIQSTQITITEGTSGEICIVLENVAGGLERNVSVTLIITAGTAGIWAILLHFAGFRECAGRYSGYRKIGSLSGMDRMGRTVKTTKQQKRCKKWRIERFQDEAV